MKKIFVIILFLVSATAFSQSVPYERPQKLGTDKSLVEILGKLKVNGYIYYIGDTANTERPTQSGARIIHYTDLKEYSYDKTLDKWERDSSSVGSAYDSSFNANRTITRDIPGLSGINLNKSDVKATLEELLYPTQFPTVTLTGGEVLELLAAGIDLGKTLNYSIRRQPTTVEIDTVIIAGVPYTSFDNSEGPDYTESGTQPVAVPRNTTTTFSIIATTTDGKSDTSYTSFSFRGRRYWGWVNDTSNLANSASDATIAALSSELIESNSKSFTTTDPTPGQFFVFAYRSTSPLLASLKMNGFESLSAMSFITRSFTTATGYEGTWRIYWSKIPQSVASLIETY